MHIYMMDTIPIYALFKPSKQDVIVYSYVLWPTINKPSRRRSVREKFAF
jgi:hypothetical protein